MTDASFSATMWADCLDLRRDIGRHPFVEGIFDGTLPRPAFDHYVEQDVHYLSGYAVALQACAAQAETAESVAFWAVAARDTVEIEQLLHQEYLPGRPLPDRSAHCSAYVSLLLDLAGRASPPVLAAAVLPCFWIYSDLGVQSAEMDLRRHPYAGWVETYRDPRFAAGTDKARALVDGLATGSSESVRAAMLQAFRSACRYERLLFDDAWTRGALGDAATATSPVPARLNGSARASATTNEASDADNHG